MTDGADHRLQRIAREPALQRPAEGRAEPGQRVTRTGTRQQIVPDGIVASMPLNRESFLTRFHVIGERAVGKAESPHLVGDSALPTARSPITWNRVRNDSR